MVDQKIKNKKNTYIPFKKDDFKYEKKYLIILFSIAIIVRIIIMIEFISNYEPMKSLIVDENLYDILAKHLAGTFDLGFFNLSPADTGYAPFVQPPFYAIFLAPFYLIFNNSFIAVKFIQCILGSLASCMTYILARHYLNNKYSFIAGILMAVFGPSILYDTCLLPPTLLTTLILLILILLHKYSQDVKNTKLLILIAIILGVSVLTRPECIIFLFVIILWMIFVLYKKNMWRVKDLIIRASIITCIVFVLISLVTVRNYTVSKGQFVPITYNGGINFYIGNYSNYEELLKARPNYSYMKIYLEPYFESNNFSLPQDEQNKYFIFKTIDWIANNFTSWLEIIGEKTLLMINSLEIPRNEDPIGQSEFSFLLSLLFFNFNGFTFPGVIIYPLALSGLILTMRRWKEYFLLLSFIISYSFIIIMVYVTSRYRVPIAPVIIITATVFLCDFINQIKLSRLKNVLIYSIILIISLIICNLPFANEKYYDADYQSITPAQVGTQYSKNGHYKEAFFYLERAIKLSPKNVDLIKSYGSIFFKLAQVDIEHNNYDSAIARINNGIPYMLRAAELSNNQYPDVYFNLANIYITLVDIYKIMISSINQNPNNEKLYSILPTLKSNIINCYKMSQKYWHDYYLAEKSFTNYPDVMNNALQNIEVCQKEMNEFLNSNFNY